MSKNNTPIVKAEGVNASEKLLTQLCDKVFLKLWAYANPQKKKGIELCDVLAVFENHVFIFSDKDPSFKSERANKTDFEKWESWKSDAIDGSIRQIKGAEKWIRKNPEKIFLDAQCTVPLPLTIDKENLKIHRIIVAHGAKEACKNDSQNNINGSLAIAYADLKDSKKLSETLAPFCLTLPKNEVVHVFDSHNLKIILGELDTVHDLLWYFEAKEEAIKKYTYLSYCGEEDLLAMYLTNFDEESQKHYIGAKDEKFDGIGMEEGFWEDFIKSGPYKRRKEADKVSYLWDNLLQKTLQNALDGVLIGDGNIFKGETAMSKMAKEPRVSRRIISGNMQNAIVSFPTDPNKLTRHLGCYSSFYPDLMYVFLQLSPPPSADYKTEYRPVRRILLEIACGVAKNKFPHLKTIIGIAIDPPILGKGVSEDFMLMNCENWTKEQAEYYKKENKETGFNFFETDNLETGKGKTYEFPPE